MERTYTIAGAPEVKVAVRVRGMSHEELYFDEQTSTTRLTRDFIVIHLRNRVDLDFEVHITNMVNQVGGIYRVAWINTHPHEGGHSVGLELLDAEGEIWEADSISAGVAAEDAAPAALLECQRCNQRVTTTLPEVVADSLREGFSIARPCDTCKATTGWVFCIEKSPAAAEGREEAPPQEITDQAAEASGALGGTRDNREKGRAPIRLAIKIIRSKYGLKVFDICETLNVSRTGVYFATEQGYEVGENLEVIVPYHPDSVAILLPAQVVRQDGRLGTSQKRVAIQFTSASPLPTSG